MNDLTKITADNAVRRELKLRASSGPWTIYTALWKLADRKFVAAARNDNAEDVIDELVAEVERLREALDPEKTIEG